MILGFDENYVTYFWFNNNENNVIFPSLKIYRRKLNNTGNTASLFALYMQGFIYIDLYIDILIRIENLKILF